MFVPFDVLRARLLWMIESRQAQGRATDGLAGEVEAAPDDYQTLFELMQRIDAAPVRSDWRYDEPSDLEAIRRERTAVADHAVPRIADAAARARSGFLSSVAGCILGKPVEVMLTLDELRGGLRRIDQWPLRDYISERIATDSGLPYLHPDWPECVRERISWVAADDDINYTLLGMMTLEEHGLDFTKGELRRMWLDNVPLGYTWGPERTFLTKQGLAMGIVEDPDMDLDEMAATQNPGDELCGAMIRADAYGYACPGRPVLASELAWRDASMTHRGNGIYGSMFAAAAIAAAFTTTDPSEVVRVALSCVPARSRFHEIVADSLLHVEAADGWLDAYERIHGKYAEYGHCRVFQETGTLVNSLYHASDVGDGICLQVMQGNDTDSYGATAGAILGVLHGPDGLAARWLEPFQDVLHTRLAGYWEPSLRATADRISRLPALTLE